MSAFFVLLNVYFMNDAMKCAYMVRHYGIENVRVDGDAVGIFGPMGHTFYLDDAEIRHRAIDYDELQDELIYEK
jgi:hypothetical protein